VIRPLAESNSASAARGSIGTPVTRCTQVESRAIWAAAAKALSVAS
jgi:hypothetical protein